MGWPSRRATRSPPCAAGLARSHAWFTAARCGLGPRNLNPARVDLQGTGLTALRLRRRIRQKELHEPVSHQMPQGERGAAAATGEPSSTLLVGFACLGHLGVRRVQCNLRP